MRILSCVMCHVSCHLFLEGTVPIWMGYQSTGNLQEKKCSKWDRLSSASIIQYPLIWGSAWPMDTPFQVRLPSSMDTKMSLSDSSTLRLSAQTWIKRLETAAKESSSPSLASPSSEATLCSKCWSPQIFLILFQLVQSLVRSLEMHEHAGWMSEEFTNTYVNNTSPNPCPIPTFLTQLPSPHGSVIENSANEPWLPRQRMVL